MDLNLSDGGTDSREDASVQNHSVAKENDDLKVELLEDMDEYLDDINSRLTISRMVTDSVIRGMVKAVEQEAAERINADHLTIKESLGSLETIAKNQLKKLEEVENMREFNFVSQVNSRLNGYLPKEISEGWTTVDNMVDFLKILIDAAFRKMNDMVCLSIESLSLQQQEHAFQEEVERTVLEDCIRALKEEFEQKLQENSAQSMSDDSSNWLDCMKEMLSLRQEVSLISKSLNIHEVGHPLTEDQNHRKSDHLNCKLSGSLGPSISLREVNDKHDKSATTEKLDIDQLKGLSFDGLISHFKTEMNKMKIEYDYRVQQLTEANFTLKRELLNSKERGSFSPVKRDKELEPLRRKLAEVSLKLDKILPENYKLPTFGRNECRLDSLKDRRDSLASENHQLRDSLAEKEKEVVSLRSQACDASKRISRLSQAEEDLLKTVRSLEAVIEDSQIEVSITKDVYGCHFGGLVAQMESLNKESHWKYHVMEQTNDSYIKSVIAQQVSVVLLGETWREAEDKISELSIKYYNESKVRASHEMSLLESKKALKSEVEENGRLKQDILSLTGLVEENVQQVCKAQSALAKETERVDVAFLELQNLRGSINQQARKILESSEESRVTKSKLDESLKQIELHDAETHALRQNLEEVERELKKTLDEKMRFLAFADEKQQQLAMTKARDTELRKQIASLTLDGLVRAFTSFESRVAESVQKSNSRLKSVQSQLSSLTEGIDILKQRGSIYKEGFEKKSSDLQKAEAEVDLLGDEVDSLLSLLEKIYIALDHYSPVLKHYSGITEILRLVRRELSGEGRR